MNPIKTTKWQYNKEQGKLTDEFGFVQEEQMTDDVPMRGKPKEELPEGYKWVRVIQGKYARWEQAHNIHERDNRLYAVILAKDLSLESIVSYDGMFWYVDLLEDPNDHTGEVHEEPEEKFLAMLDETKYTPSVGKTTTKKTVTDIMGTWLKLLEEA